MNKRLKELRKSLRINQTDFAARIGIAQNGYSLVETGRNALTEQNIKLICLTFRVNEAWLRTGEGPMLIPEVEPKDEEEKALLEMFRRLSPEMRAFVLRKIQELLRIDQEFEAE